MSYNILENLAPRVLKFNNATFREGENLTVRLGTKWAGKVGVAQLEDGRLIDIYKTVSKRFRTILDGVDFLYLEHDSNCRTVEGLKNEMERIYGDLFDVDHVVTLIYFSIQDDS